MKNNFSKQLWISFGIIIASIVIAIVVFYSFSNDLTKLTAQIVADRDASQKQADSLSNLAGLKLDAAAAEHYQVAMKQLLPDQYGLAAFNPWLSKIAKSYGVTVSAVFQGSAVQPAQAMPGTIVFTLEAKGPQGSLAPFLKNITSQTPGYIIAFSAFDFTNDGSQEALTAQGTLYFR